MRRCLIAVSVLLVAAAPFDSACGLAQGKQEDKKVDKSKHPWAKWQPGSYVKFKVLNDMGVMKQEGEITQTLTKVTDEEYTLKIENKIGGQDQTQEQTSDLAAGSVKCDPDAEKVGEETLTVDGKEYKCTIWKSVAEQGGSEVETKAWIADGMDLALKAVSKVAAPVQIETEMTAVKLSEEVAVGDKKINCMKLEGKIKMAMGEGTIVNWMSLEVPGAVAKSATALSMSGMKMTATMELVAFEAKK